VSFTVPNHALGVFKEVVTLCKYYGYHVVS